MVKFLFIYYSKRHNKFLFPALAGAIYGSPCEAKNEISNVVNYRISYMIKQESPSKEIPARNVFFFTRNAQTVHESDSGMVTSAAKIPGSLARLR